MPCTFCVDPHAAGEVVFEDESTWVMLHPDWSPRGHAMVVAKQHVENASGLDEEEWLHVARVWHRAERVLLEATGADRAIVLKLGIMTPHLHLHIYPMGAEATREDVFAAIDGKLGIERDGEWVEKVKREMEETSHPSSAPSPLSQGEKADVGSRG
ncbi:MAG TPA: HIT family protein [Thermoanaerobaculia bacterium]|jgi:diadenosine tetraphosphate (Ap4A) HIT family hydrolase|nr:HIT family protein [Thermoanaerobaculia bacterium]